ncbi:MAG: hypothetical protein WD078_05625 [Woeseia sp.]
MLAISLASGYRWRVRRIPIKEIAVSDPKKPPGAGSDERRVQTDDRGRSVWVGTIETAELEIVSTQMLKTLLDSADAGNRKQVEQLASRDDEGFLARNAATGHFQIIDDTDLQAILNQQKESAPAPRPDSTDESTLVSDSDENDLSLVSTQALRKILGESTGEKRKARATPDEKFSRDDAGGFDPYNTG